MKEAEKIIDAIILLIASAYNEVEQAVKDEKSRESIKKKLMNATKGMDKLAAGILPERAEGKEGDLAKMLKGE